VARIEQTETPAMMEERIANLPRKAFKYERVVEREVCQVSTKGTRVNNFLDSENFEGDPRQAFFSISFLPSAQFSLSFLMQCSFVKSAVFLIQIH
jgi:hypothetical protein